MPFITAIRDDQATGAAAMYEADRQAFGYLLNLTMGFSLRPDVYAAWRQLNGTIKANMDLRRYQFATVAAAKPCAPAIAPSRTANPPGQAPQPRRPPSRLRRPRRD